MPGQARPRLSNTGSAKLAAVLNRWSINVPSPTPSTPAAPDSSPPSSPVSSSPHPSPSCHVPSPVCVSSPFAVPPYEPLSSPNFYTYNSVDNAHNELTSNPPSPDIYDTLAQLTLHVPDIMQQFHDLTSLDPCTYNTATLSTTVELPFEQPTDILNDVATHPIPDDMTIDFGFPPADTVMAVDSTMAPMSAEPMASFDDIEQWLNTGTPQPQPTSTMPTASTPPLATLPAAAPPSPDPAPLTTTATATANDRSPEPTTVTTAAPPVSLSDTSAPRVRVAGRSIAETQEWRSKTLTFRTKGQSRGVAKRYARPHRGFILNTDKRSKAHSEQVLRIEYLIKKLDKETAPFLFFYCSRPESVALSHGGNHSHVSAAVRDALGEAEVTKLLNTVHDGCRDSTMRALQEMKESIDINLEVTRARHARDQAARVLSEMKRLMGEHAMSSIDSASMQAQLEQLTSDLSNIA
ncbi:hypothetical protein K466DRAFT_606323 [Polyporus arcularius HHB13444]|uniref:Uncharacterized protein n=1 Tax=Polyporus arcularius HHB13444 TaxID=1314778 RepID=A0A5C3NS42_9APHY|nr:hypothetical protein K466DRAFT_606323 [Polyporus arcularius HHB13444]